MNKFHPSSLAAARNEFGNYLTLDQYVGVIRYTLKPVGVSSEPPFAQLHQPDLDAMWQYIATNYDFVPSRQEKAEAECYFCTVAEGDDQPGE